MADRDLQRDRPEGWPEFRAGVESIETLFNSGPSSHSHFIQKSDTRGQILDVLAEVVSAAQFVPEGNPFQMLVDAIALVYARTHEKAQLEE